MNKTKAGFQTFQTKKFEIIRIKKIKKLKVLIFAIFSVLWNLGQISGPKLETLLTFFCPYFGHFWIIPLKTLSPVKKSAHLISSEIYPLKIGHNFFCFQENSKDNFFFNYNFNIYKQYPISKKKTSKNKCFQISVISVKHFLSLKTLSVILG